MDAEIPRSREARAAAEAALVRVVHHYGTRPEFVVLGGLVPELLCTTGPYTHAGTTDIDVQVDLEIAAGSVNTARLERALRNAEFMPDGQYQWRWVTPGPSPKALVKFELLADLDDAPAGAILAFDDCDELGAANLRGTGFAARDIVVRELRARIGGDLRVAEVNVTGLAGFLLAKVAAARARRKPKDWYDVAFVLLHNDVGGPEAAALLSSPVLGTSSRARSASRSTISPRTSSRNAQGPQAYAAQMLLDHPELDEAQVHADAILAVETFHTRLSPA